MLYFWNLIYALLLIIASPYYLLIKRPFTKRNFKISERLGKNLLFPSKKSKRLWFHAVSLGEINLVVPIIKSLKEKNNYEILITSTTTTGLEIARKKLGGFCYVQPSPFDLTSIVKKFYEKFLPDILVLVEAELWPALLWEGKKRNIPVVLLNARFGTRTKKLFKLFKFFISKFLNNIDRFLVQSEATKDFLLSLHIKENKIVVTGSLKADLPLLEYNEEWLNQKREEFNLSCKRVIVAGSTVDGEEEILLKIFKKIRKEELVLVIAPRRPERFTKVEKIIKQFGLRYQKKSNFRKEKFEVLLLDTIGELPDMYALSDCCFVGGSLVRKGGHNFLEPLFYKKPVFFGPFMQNFKELADIFVSNSGVKILKTSADIEDMFMSAGSDHQKRMGLKGYEILCGLKGAKESSIKEIISLL